MQIYIQVHDDVPSGMKQSDFQVAMCLHCLTHNQGVGLDKCCNCGGPDLVFYREAGIRLDSYQLKQLVDDSMS